MSLRPQGIHHVNITVGDRDEAMTFYCGLLGLTERTDRPDFPFPGAWLDVGAQQFHLVVGTPRAPDGDHVAILVDDLEDAVAEVSAAGVAVTSIRAAGTSRQAFVRDPWGNRIELHQLGG